MHETITQRLSENLSFIINLSYIFSKNLQLFQFNQQKIVDMEDELSFSVPKWRKKEIIQLSHPIEQQIYKNSDYNISDFYKQHLRNKSIIAQYEIKTIDNNRMELKKLDDSKNRDLFLFILILKSKINPRHSNHQKQFMDFKLKLYQLNFCTFDSKFIPAEKISMYSNKLLKKILLQYLKKCESNHDLIELILRKNQAIVFAINLIIKSICVLRGIEYKKFTDDAGTQKTFEFVSEFFNLTYEMTNNFHKFQLFTIYENNNKFYQVVSCTIENNNFETQENSFSHRETLTLTTLQNQKQSPTVVKQDTQIKKLKNTNSQKVTTKQTVIPNRIPKKKWYSICFDCF